MVFQMKYYVLIPLQINKDELPLPQFSLFSHNLSFIITPFVPLRIDPP